MSKLYIANTSKQNQIICYRLDYDSEGNQKDANRRFEAPRQQEVPPGRQIQLGGDMHINQITDIVDQLAPYGLVGVVDVPRLGRRVVPYVYNIDQAVPAKVIEQVAAGNAATRIDEGKDRRQRAAIAANDKIQNVVAEQFAERGIDAAPPERTDVTIEQQDQSELGEKPIAEGFHVVPAPKAGARGGKTPSGKNRARRN